MSSDIVPIQRGMNDITIFLDIRALAKPGVLEISPLSDEHVFGNAAVSHNDCVVAQKSTDWNGYRRFSPDFIEYLLELPLEILCKFHKNPFGRLAWNMAYIAVQHVLGKLVTELECAVNMDPYLAWFNLMMAQFPNLHVGISPDDAVMESSEVNSAERPKKASFHRGAVYVRVVHGYGVLYLVLFRTLRVVRMAVNEGLQKEAVPDQDDLIVMEGDLHAIV
jgi:hypothetical protein